MFDHSFCMSCTVLKPNKSIAISFASSARALGGVYIIPVRVSFWYEFIPVLLIAVYLFTWYRWKISYQYNSYRYEILYVNTPFDKLLFYAQVLKFKLGLQRQFLSGRAKISGQNKQASGFHNSAIYRSFAHYHINFILKLTLEKLTRGIKCYGFNPTSPSPSVSLSH